MTKIDELIAENARLLAALRAERALTNAAYGLPAPQDEAPSPTFQETRRETEARSGSRLTKFFAPVRTAMPAPPATILVMTECRLLALPEPLLAQAQACEKAYAAGRWHIATPADLWQSLTRLLGGIQA